MVTASAGFLAASVVVRGEVAAVGRAAETLNRTAGLLGDAVIVRADGVFVVKVADDDERGFGGAVAVEVVDVAVELAVGRDIGALNIN